jgi:hypothetical protein
MKSIFARAKLPETRTSRKEGQGRFAHPWSPGAILGSAAGSFKELTRSLPRVNRDENVRRMRLLTTNRHRFSLRLYPKRNGARRDWLRKASLSIMCPDDVRLKDHFAFPIVLCHCSGSPSVVARARHDTNRNFLPARAFVAYVGSATVAVAGYSRPGAMRITNLFWINAGVLERLQRFSPGRHPLIADFGASALGAFFGGQAPQPALRVACGGAHIRASVI